MASTFNNAKVQLSTTGATSLYQAPTGAGAVSIVLSTLVANVSGATGSFTMTLTDSSDAVQSRIINATPIPPNSTLEVVTNKVVLKSGEKLRATAGGANFFDVTVSALELTS